VNVTWELRYDDGMIKMWIWDDEWVMIMKKIEKWSWNDVWYMNMKWWLKCENEMMCEMW